MNLIITGVHFEITPALREYIETKFARITKRLDNVTNTTFTLSVDKLEQKAEVDMHLAGKVLHAEAVSTDMYASIDELMDKLDRQIMKHKEKMTDHRVASKPAEDMI